CHYLYLAWYSYEHHKYILSFPTRRSSDLAKIMLENFKKFTGVYPKTIFTNGSIARSYLLAYKEIKVRELQFKSLFSKSVYFDKLDRKSTRLNSSHVKISYAVFCLKKKNNK